MHVIFQYDIKRLNAYRRNSWNKDRITINAFGSIHLLSFLGVDYFNYTFLDPGKSLCREEIMQIHGFYARKGISRHRILLSSSGPDNMLLAENETGYKFKGKIFFTCYPSKNEVTGWEIPGIIFLPVDDRNICLYTETYLRSFDATGREVDTVCENFRQLLTIKDLEMFMVMQENRIAGISVLFSCDHDYYLAGGAMLPGFRNQAFHKASIAFRINRSLKDPECREIVSWAYSDSISFQNMRKLNMITEQELIIYEYSG